MTAYLILVAVVVVLFSLDYIRQKEGYGVLTLAGIFVIWLFTILRHEIGYDYLNYVGFLNQPTGQLVESNFEWGFIVLAGIRSALDLDHFWVFLFFGTAIIAYMFRGIKLYTANVRIAVVIFLLIPGLFLNSLTIIRQSLAMMFLFNAYRYLFEKRYRPFCGWVFLAVLFHYSALIVLPIFWLATKLERKAIWVLALGVPLSLILARLNVVGMIIGAVLGSSKFAVYLGMDDGGTNLVKLIVLNLSVIPYIFFYRRMDPLNRSLLVLVVFGLMLLNVFANVAAITRIGYYFKIFEIVLLANVVSYFKKGASQVLFCVLLFFYFFTMFYSSLKFDYTGVNEYPKLTPYKTIFERDE